MCYQYHQHHKASFIASLREHLYLQALDGTWHGRWNRCHRLTRAVSRVSSAGTRGTYLRAALLEEQHCHQEDSAVHLDIYTETNCTIVKLNCCSMASPTSTISPHASPMCLPVSCVFCKKKTKKSCPSTKGAMR